MRLRLFLLSCLLLTPAMASTVITVDASQFGYAYTTTFTVPGLPTPYTSSGSGTGSYEVTNSTGNSLLAGSEQGNWFDFVIPTLTGKVLSATLLIQTYGLSSTGIVYTVTERTVISPTDLADLLGGTYYASKTYSSVDANTIQSIDLSSAISDIQSGGTFRLAGTASATGLAVSLFDSGSITPQLSDVQLLLTVATPEPGSLLLIGTGLALFLRKRFRGNAQLTK